MTRNTPTSEPPDDPIAATATTPPSSPAPMDVACWIANWSENSSLRCPGALCSVMNGEPTTPIVWVPATYMAPRSHSIGRAVVINRPASATSISTPPSSSTSFRPIRLDSRLMGNATSAEASDEPVAISPMVAVSWPSAARYR